eukprot:9370651-Ditylum_brightwellii.AAC.2
MTYIKEASFITKRLHLFQNRSNGLFREGGNSRLPRIQHTGSASIITIITITTSTTSQSFCQRSTSY